LSAPLSQHITPSPYTTLFRSHVRGGHAVHGGLVTGDREVVLPILFDEVEVGAEVLALDDAVHAAAELAVRLVGLDGRRGIAHQRSEEHTGELQSRENLVCPSL